MPKSPATNTHQLIKPVHVLGMGVVVSCALVAIFPRIGFFGDGSGLFQGDDVSIEYLRAQLRTSPDSSETHLALTKQLVRQQRWKEAWDVVSDFKSLNPHETSQAKELQLEIAWRYYNTLPEHERATSAAKKTLEEILHTSLQYYLQNDEKAMAADIALQIGRPDLAVQYYLSLSQSDTAQQGMWYGKAATWELASGHPKQASAYFMAAHQHEKDENQRQHWFQQALASAEQSSDSAHHYQLIKRYLDQYPQTAEILESAVKLAIATKDIESAKRWNDVLLKQTHDGTALLARQVELELSTHDQKTAYRLLKRNLAKNPNNPVLLEKIAQVAEWQGLTNEANRYWTQLFELRPRNRVLLDKMISIALATGDLAKATQYLRQKLRLAPDDYQVRESLAEVEEWYNRHSLALRQWQQLALNRGQLRDFSEQIRLSVMLHDTRRLVQALELKRRKFRLNDAEVEQLIEGYMALGHIQKATRSLANYIAQGNRNPETWQRLLRLQIDNDDATVTANWHRFNQYFSNDPYSHVMYGDYLLQRNRIDALRDLLSNTLWPTEQLPTAALEQLGELAWRAQNVPLATQVYQTLWNRRIPGIGNTRLITLVQNQQGYEAANQLRVQLWQREQTHHILQSAIFQAWKHQSWIHLEELLALAKTVPDVRDSEGFWLATAALAESENNNKAIEQAYQKALSFNPESSQTRTALLWLMLNQERWHEAATFLKTFSPHHYQNPTIWPAIALTLQNIGDETNALLWYKKLSNEHASDPLWQLEYADALARNAYHHQAYNVRRRVMDRLIAAPEELQALLFDRPSLDNRLLRLVQHSRGDARTEQLLDHAIGRDTPDLDANSSLIAAAWLLEKGNLKKANDLLQSRLQERQQNPAWINMGVALKEKNLTEVEAILEKQSAELTLLQKIQAHYALGDYATAKTLTDKALTSRHSPTVRSLTQTASELSNLQPASISLSVHSDEVGNVDVRQKQAQLLLSYRNFTFDIDHVDYTLSSRDPLFKRALTDGTHTQVEIGYQTRWGQLFAATAQRDLNGIETTPTAFGIRSNLTQSTSFSLRAYDQNETRDNGALFGLASRRGFEVNITQPLGAHAYIRLAADRYTYEDRNNNDLGDATQLSTELGYRLLTGRTQARIGIRGTRFDASANASSDNTLVNDLNIATTQEVIPDDFNNVGFVFNLSRGDLASASPQVASPRYSIDGWLGKNLTTDEWTHNISLGLGSKLLGSDEISLSTTYSDSSTDQQQSTWLRYRYFFDH